MYLNCFLILALGLINQAVYSSSINQDVSRPFHCDSFEKLEELKNLKRSVTQFENVFFFFRR